MPSQELKSRAIAGRTARCRCNFWYVSKARRHRVVLTAITRLSN